MSDDTQDPRAAPLECRVHSGPQAGARSPVPDGESLGTWELLVGPTDAPESSSGHDLMLAGGVPARLRVTRDPARDARGDPTPLRLRLLAGQAWFDSGPLVVGIDVSWPMYALLHIGETSLSYGSAATTSWPLAGRDAARSGATSATGQRSAPTSAAAESASDGPRFDAEPASTEAASTAVRGDDQVDPDPSAPALAAVHRSWPARVGLAGVTLVIGSALVFGLMDRLGYGKPLVRPETVSQALIAKGHDGLTVRAEGDAITITGSVASDAQRVELETLNAQRQWHARIDVRVPVLRDEVSRACESELGIKPINVDKTPDGRIVLYTRTDKLGTRQEIERAKSLLRARVPGLVAIDIDNQLPPVASSCVKRFDDPGEQVTSIVWDEKRPSLNTANGKTYFLGSLLPNGQRLVAIDRHRVATLECDGQHQQITLGPSGPLTSERNQR